MHGEIIDTQTCFCRTALCRNLRWGALWRRRQLVLFSVRGSTEKRMELLGFATDTVPPPFA